MSQARWDGIGTERAGRLSSRAAEDTLDAGEELRSRNPWMMQKSYGMYGSLLSFLFSSYHRISIILENLWKSKGKSINSIKIPRKILQIMYAWDDFYPLSSTTTCFWFWFWFPSPMIYWSSPSIAIATCNIFKTLLILYSWINIKKLKVRLK